MSKYKASPILSVGIALIICIGISLFIRISLPYDKIFIGDWIKFASVDAYYHMRLVDLLVHNFPNISDFDPYFIYPGGGWISNLRFFDWLMAGSIWVIGLGSPTQHTIDIVAVYYPAILGALTVIPVYVIGKQLFGHRAGVLSAALIAIMPGEFLGRSILGFTDHHVFETLLTAFTMMFLILTIKIANQRQLTFNHLRSRDWQVIAKPIAYSLITGVTLGLYLITWAGGLLLIFLISLFLASQFLIDYFRHKSTDYLCIIGVITFLISMVIYLLLSRSMVVLVAIAIAILIPIVLSAISRLTVRKKLKPVYFPVILVGMGLVGLGLLYAVNPSLLRSMLGLFNIFFPTGTQLATIEMQPLLFPQGQFTMQIAMGNFASGFLISIVMLIFLIYQVRKYGSPERNLLIAWSLVMLLATLGQRRFAYYLAVNIALLSGYMLKEQFLPVLTKWSAQRFLRIAIPIIMAIYIVSYSGFSSIAVTISVALLTGYVIWQLWPSIINARNTKAFKYLNWVFATLILLVVFYPILQLALATATPVRFAPSNAWVSSLDWLKENTPNPFKNPDQYFHLEESDKYLPLYWLKDNIPNPSGDPDFHYNLEESYKYPESAYGVTAWWDYGYWITRIAQRMPSANPGQNTVPVTLVAKFLTSQDEESAEQIKQDLDSSYVVIDYLTITGKYWAVILWAGQESSQFFDYYLLQQEENKWVPIQLYHPEFYRSMAIRLYSFNGEAVIPEQSIVITYEERKTDQGQPVKLVTDVNDFPSYEEAIAFISGQESGNYKIVSDHPFSSPVPLEALENYQLIHNSEETVTIPNMGAVPEVKIFKYVD